MHCVYKDDKPDQLYDFSGADYLPFAEIPSLRNMVLTGEDDEDMSYMAQIDSPYAKHALPPAQGPPSDNNTPFPGPGSGRGGASGFRPVYD